MGTAESDSPGMDNNCVPGCFWAGEGQRPPVRQTAEASPGAACPATLIARAGENFLF